MATVRFFAQAREAAGSASLQCAGTTVEAVLSEAIAQCGEELARVVATSKVWLNGEEVPRQHVVTDNDEVAVLPPVSGGI
jgi:molybdopterin synthase sulfur carrier subunit